MGKLRFTLTYILFWFVIVFSCLLAENFSLFSTDHMGGMSPDSLMMLSLFIIFALVFYYFLEHKKNKLTFDKILLPIIVVFGLVCIATIWWQGPRVFDNKWKFLRESVSFTPYQKLSYSLEVIIWCAVLYGVLFAFNRYSISKRLFRWLPFVYVVSILVCSFIDIFLEFDKIVTILTDPSDYPKVGMSFIVYNTNVWGMLLLIGLLSCLTMNLKKFNLFYLISMIFLLVMIVFTSSTASIFVGLSVVVIYTTFEIICLMRKNRKKGLTILLVFIGSTLVSISLLLILSLLNVSFAKSILLSIERRILLRDYSTVSHRRELWASVYHFLLENPADFIFGCGYKTGNILFARYNETIQSGLAARSMHNGLFEIFLRHGIFGVIFYVSAFVPFAFGVIKLIKKKQYRLAFIHTICVLGVIGHSIAESTTFFTPNIQGMYLTIVFYLPVVNVTKENYFAELKEKSISQIQKEEPKVDIAKVFRFLELMSMGLISAMVSSLTITYLHTNTGVLVAYFITIAILIVSLLITPLLSLICNDKKTSIIQSNSHPIILLTTVGAGFVFSGILQSIFTFDLFSSLLFTIFVFTFYFFALQLMDEKNNYLLFSFFNSRFSLLLKDN